MATTVIGQTIGSHQVVAKLGEGGMGEVYRARDAKLNRDVAIKVLPAALAADPHRRARLEREAQALAALNHPHIAHVYGLEESHGGLAIVMELVEGPTVAELITAPLPRSASAPSGGGKPRGGGLPIDQAISIATQVADALEAAHAAGIVHRDLKPANIKVRPDGVVKVLDFGLARMVNPGIGTSGAIADSPTLTVGPAMTAQGVILGTAAYMAPEQARGRLADARSDLWAFGVVLYEMLTGALLFTGKTTSDVLASVLRDEPDWTTLPPDTPPRVRRVLHRCLQKDPQQRLRHAGDARLELTDGATEDVERETARPARPAAPRVPKAAPWVISGLAIAMAAAFAMLALRQPSVDRAQRPLQRLTIETPEGMRVTGRPVISPDGRHVVVVADGRLHVRRMDSLAFQPLQGTEDAREPFWSPDSRRIGFTSGPQVKIVTLGGDVETLCTLDGVGWGGAWSSQGTMVFSKGPNSHNSDGATLVLVSPASGAWKPFTTLDSSRGDLAHGLPEFLPDGRRVAFTVVSSDPRKSGVYVASLDSPRNQRPFPVPTKGSVLFAAGHALVSRGGSVQAYRFDPDRIEATGEPTLLAGDVASFGEASEEFDRSFSVSRDGVMVYRASGAVDVQLQWVRRDGTRVADLGRPAGYTELRLSPDETRAAVTNTGIWLLDTARGTPLPFAPDGCCSVWSPDGSEIVFTVASTAERTGSRSPSRLFRKSTRHSGPAVPVLPPGTHADAQAWAKDWTRDGRTLVYLTQTEGRNRAFSVRLDGASAPVPLDLAGTVFDFMRISPDGRLLAYMTRIEGRAEVFVQPFSGPGERTRVSDEGGGQPQWRADGRELYYVTPGGALMAVPIGSRRDVGAGSPQRLFQLRDDPEDYLSQYAPIRDGQRFLTLVPVGRRLTLRVVSDWQLVSGRQR